MSTTHRAGLFKWISTLWTTIRGWRWFALTAAVWTTVAAALLVSTLVTENWVVFLAGPALFFFFAFVYWLTGRAASGSSR